MTIAPNPTTPHTQEEPRPTLRLAAAGPGPEGGASRLERLATVLKLQQAARRAPSTAQLFDLIVHDTRHFLDYRQAVVWHLTANGRVRLGAVSGVDAHDPHAPWARYLVRLVRHLRAGRCGSEPVLVGPGELAPRLASEWQRRGLGWLLWCPFVDRQGVLIGGALFFREAPWPETAPGLMADLSEAYAHAWQLLRQGRAVRRGGRLTLPLLFLLAAAAMLLPVRLSVLAPAEITPRDPTIVSAPVDGVVASFFITPNQTVSAGQPLFELDDTTVRNALAVARKSLDIVRADYKRATQKAFGDRRSRAEIHLLKARLAEKRAETVYLAELLAKSKVAAPRSGIAIFADVNDWLGKPVAVGEKILVIADPGQVEADIRLAVSDAINLDPGAEVRLFLDVQPHRPLTAALRRAAFAAEATADGRLAFRLKAALSPGTPPPRIGLRGTAKLYGQKVSLLYYLFRRPLTAVRQYLGI